MKTLCLNFTIHQPFRLNHFPFTKIGSNQEYFDAGLNASILKEEAVNYLKLNRLLLQIIRKNPGKFKVNFCISGTALDQFESYSQELLESFCGLSETGKVEFLGSTHANSLSALISRREFASQVRSHSKKIQQLFGQRPKTFLTSKLTYTEVIGEILFNQGFEKIIFDGIELSPEKGVVNQVFRSPIHESLSFLSINQSLSDPLNFLIGSTYKWTIPLTVENYINRILSLPDDQNLVNLNLNYSHLGKSIENGIQVSGFFDKLISQSLNWGIQFKNFSSLGHQGSTTLDSRLAGFNLHPNQEKRGIYTYLGNHLQQEAFYELYNLEDQVLTIDNSALRRSWMYLQSSDHFYYMNTEYQNDFYPSPIFSPYQNPFKAYINFMNVLSDFKVQVERLASFKESPWQFKVQKFRNSYKPGLREPQPQKRLTLSLS